MKKVLSALGDAAVSLGMFVGIVSVCVVVAGKAFAGSTVQTASSVQGAIPERAAPPAPASSAVPAVMPASLRLIQEEVRIAAPGGYEIAATILRPAGKGPFGVVVLNHGVPGSADEREKESAAADFNASAPV